MNAIVTVIGQDRVGIIANICTLLADNNVNILDISQTILQGNFTMVNDQGVEASPQMNYGTELIDAHQNREGKTCVHALIADFPTDSKWVDVIYTDAENTFTLRIDLEGGAVYEEASPS